MKPCVHTPSTGRAVCVSELSREGWAPGTGFPASGGVHRRPSGSSAVILQRASQTGSAQDLAVLRRMPLPLPPAGQPCSWTSTARSPGSSEATSCWCLWAMTSATTSPTSGMLSSPTTSGSSTSSTASPTSTCRCEGHRTPGLSAGPQPSPSPEVPCSPLLAAKQGLGPPLCQNSFPGSHPVCEVQRVGPTVTALRVGRIRPLPRLYYSSVPGGSGTDGNGFWGPHRPSLAPSLTTLMLCTRRRGWNQGPGLQAFPC